MFEHWTINNKLVYSFTEANTNDASTTTIHDIRVEWELWEWMRKVQPVSETFLLLYYSKSPRNNNKMKWKGIFKNFYPFSSFIFILG